MKKAIVKSGFVRCPICNRIVFKITGNESAKNIVMQCPRKISGIAHEFIINLEDKE